MYHYVRPMPDPEYPHLRALDLDDFRRQLDAIGDRLVPRRAFVDDISDGRAPDGWVLSFDDGLADHALDGHVCRELRERGMWGVFFGADAGRSGRAELVHATHAALGRHGAEVVAGWVRGNLTDCGVTPALMPCAHEVYGDAWQEHGEERWVKTLANYGDRSTRAAVWAAIASEAAHGWYARDFGTPSPERLHGWHGLCHSVLASLGAEAQCYEIAMQRAGSGPHLFAYPYGQAWSYNSATSAALLAANYSHAFRVEPRDATDDDIRARWHIPRWDCADPETWRGLL